MIDLVSLIEQVTSFRSLGSANNRLYGTEYWGMCPYCSGGNDRFHILPYSTNPKPRFWCRVCGVTGDHVDILTYFKNMTYIEALAELGLEPGETISHSAPLFYDDAPPPKEWQAMARTFIERAQKFLWKDKAAHALDYLRGRGLTDETIVQANLGYVPLIDGEWFTSPFSDWGLTDEMLTEKQKEKGCVKVPNGILIPWYGDGNIWKLAVKRFEAASNEPKYGQVIGSVDALFGSDSLVRGKPAMLVEGEIDALSVLQTAGEIIAPIATGSADKARIPLWIARLASLASVVLVAFDNDDNEAGDKGAQYWLDTLPKAMRWPPYAHDCNQMLQDKIDIRKWVKTGLQVAMPEPEPTPTVALQGAVETVEPCNCSGCNTDMSSPDYQLDAFYDEEGNLFCEECWQPEEDTLIEDIFVGWTPCKECGLPTGRSEPDGLCNYCWYKTLEPVRPVKEKVVGW